MSETQKQYVQILNGKWIKDAEAREHIANRGTIFLDNNSTPQDVYQAVMKNRDFGALIVYMHDYETQGIVATNDCYFIGCSEVTQEQNYAYFFDPGLIAVIKVECSDTNTVQITPEFVELSPLERVTALEDAAPVTVFDNSPTSENKSWRYGDVETAYFNFQANGTPFMYIDEDYTPCTFVGTAGLATTNPSIWFFKATTKEIIKIVNLGAETRITKEALVTEIYDAENEALTISIG